MRLAYALVTLSVLFLDQATKAMVVSRMTLYSSAPVIPGLFHITLVTNRGALFGLFHDLPDPYRSTLFTTVPLLAIALMFVFQYRCTIHDSTTQSGLALILGGALGNLADRIRLGYVIDFLDVFVGEHHWPAFNVADSCICVGVACLVIDLLARGWHRQAALPPGA
ncbi:MAG: signal peptidase II [Acidobacteria bacterium]|nr:signal peptidase II [Acidobacteriota bacterium]